MPEFELQVNYTTNDDVDFPEAAVIQLTKPEIEAVLHYMAMVGGAANLAFQPSGIIVRLEPDQWDCGVSRKENYTANLLIEESYVSLNLSKGPLILETDSLDKGQLEDALNTIKLQLK